MIKYKKQETQEELERAVYKHWNPSEYLLIHQKALNLAQFKNGCSWKLALGSSLPVSVQRSVHQS